MAAKQLGLSFSRDILAAGREVCSCSRTFTNSSTRALHREANKWRIPSSRTLFTSSWNRVSYYYQVTVETGDCFGGGTDANVFIKLVGEKGVTEEVQLPTKKGDMERGMTNSYEISAVDIGPIKRLFVRHDNTGLGPAWFLNKITVQNHKGEAHSFHCYDWLQVNHDKRNLGLVRSLLEENLRQALDRETAAELQAITDEYMSEVEETVHLKLENLLSEVVQSQDIKLARDTAVRNKQLGKDLGMNNVIRDKKDPPIRSEAATTATRKGKATQKDRVQKARSHTKSNGTKSNGSLHDDSKSGRPLAENGNKRTLMTDSSCAEIPLSPAVRFLLDTHGLERQLIHPTGPKGRILKGDVLNYMKHGDTAVKKTELDLSAAVDAKPSIPVLDKGGIKELGRTEAVGLAQEAELDFLDIPNSNIRKTIARRLTEAKISIPHSYTSMDCDVSSVLSLRRELKKDGLVLTVNDFIVKAVALALRKVPEMNSQWDGEGPVVMENVDVSVAVSTEKGLITPIVRDADQMNLQELSSTVRELAQKARDGKLKPDEYYGGTFTISNLGMFGLTHFSAIINPPQTCIMAVGGTKLGLAEDGNIASMLTVTLSYDGRALSEETTSRFLDAFKLYMENPDNFFIT